MLIIFHGKPENFVSGLKTLIRKHYFTISPYEQRIKMKTSSYLTRFKEKGIQVKEPNTLYVATLFLLFVTGILLLSLLRI